MTKLKILLAAFIVAIGLSQSAQSVIFVQQPAAGGPFDWGDIATVTLMLDARETTTLWEDTARTDQVDADGDYVLSVEDADGNGHIWEKTSGTVTYQTSELNGHPVLRFDRGTNSYLVDSSVNTETVLGDPEDFTTFIVAKPDSALNNRMTMSFESGGGGRQNQWFMYSGKITFDSPFPAGRSSVEEPTDYANNWHIFTFRKNFTTDHLIRVDGVDLLTDTTVSGTSVSTGVKNTIGAHVTNGYKFGGDIAFIIIYQESLTDAQLTEVEDEINNIWSIY